MKEGAGHDDVTLKDLFKWLRAFPALDGTIEKRIWWAVFKRYWVRSVILFLASGAFWYLLPKLLTNNTFVRQQQTLSQQQRQVQTLATTAETGTFVINPQFRRRPGAFKESLANVQVGDDDTGKWGYIDKTGKFVINPQFDSADSFSEGLARVRVGDVKTGKWGYIDGTGKFVIAPFQVGGNVSPGRFREGLVAVGDSATGKSGYVDRTGKFVISPQFDMAFDFSEGLAQVGIGDFASGKRGYIDRTGKMVVNPQFDSAEPFSEGLAVVEIGRASTRTPTGEIRPATTRTQTGLFVWGKWGFIDKTGKVVMDLQFRMAQSFHDGLAAVAVGDGETVKWGFIDKTGRMVIAPQFDWLALGDDGFFEGLARVPIGTTLSNWGFIDKTGKFVINPQFDSVFPFSDGLARVKVGNAWGYIDKTGKMVISPQFDDADAFSDGLALVRIGDEKTGKWGYISR